MIERAKREYRNEVVTLWNTGFPVINNAYTQFFFNYIYKEDQTLVYTHQGHVIGCLQRIPINIMVNGRYLKSSLLMGMVTDPRYRRQGIMSELISIQQDLCDHSELITCVLSNDNSWFTQFGYSPIYNKQTIELTRDNVAQVSHEGISFRYRANDMLKLYADFIKRFNGYAVRSKQDIELMVQRSNDLNGKVIFYYDQEDILQAYALYHYDGLVCVIDEIIYMDSISLVKLFNYCLMERHYLRVNVSMVEDFEKIFPGIKTVTHGYISAKVNDLDLLNRLYNSQCQSIDDLFALNSRCPNLIVHF